MFINVTVLNHLNKIKINKDLILDKITHNFFTKKNYLNSLKCKDSTVYNFNDYKQMRIPIITVVGRSNVGKSTLINRITKSNKDGSIVHDSEGVTKDIIQRKAFWKNYEFLMTDTGGFSINYNKKNEIYKNMTKQIFSSIEKSSLIIFVLDFFSQITQDEIELAEYLKFQEIPVILVVNKCENINIFNENSKIFWSLGFGEPIPISAIHGINTGELLEKIVSYLPNSKKLSESYTTKVSIIGKPNVGKSTFVNKLLGQYRSIVSDTPGTTSDSVDSYISGGKNCNVYNFIDTAGIKRKKSIEFGIEYFMVNRTLKSVQKSECVLFMIDINNGITDQDVKISDIIVKENKCCVILLNKWDKIKKKNE